MCPLTRMPCMERRCEWWRRTEPVWFESCVLWDMANNLRSLLFRD